MGVQATFRLITYSQEIVDGQPIIISSNCLPIKALKLEPAGHAFHSAALRLLGCEKDKTNSNVQKVNDDKQQTSLPQSDSYSSKGKKKSGEPTEQDHYALLGLGHLRYLATEDQIRKSYRETALKHHPDKQASLILAEKNEDAKQAKRDEIESHFKSIQEAYEVLIDPVRRRVYDSTDEFDDEIPSDCLPEDFFKVFGPAFTRNGRWSVNQPIPSLGDDRTPIKEVDSFYNFWYGFKSWREFPHDDEFDLEQAESRDHKRWMERQNAKLSERARKEEYARIRALVDNAYKRDPRVLRRKEEEKAEKRRKKESKYMEKRLQEVEAARLAEQEKKRKEEEEKQAAEAALLQKKAKEKEKKLLRKERACLRTLSGPIISEHLFNLSEEDIETLCMAFDLEQLRNLCDNLEGKEASEVAEALRDARDNTNDLEEGKLQDVKRNQQQNHNVRSNGNGSIGRNNKKDQPWGKEEIELLRKGMVKYPKGTSRRWEVISDYIGTKRSVEEILKSTNTALQKPDANRAFDSFLEKRKPGQTIASPLSTREEVGGVVENGAEQNGKVTESSEATVVRSENSQDKTVTDGVSLSSEQELWSAVQERALVQALKTFPKESNQRWERVAAAVPGKNVSQCKKKFASLKESFRNKKTAV